jgi:protein-disulfide isomerase
MNRVTPAIPPPLSSGKFAAGIVLLLVAIVATLLLVLQHIAGLAIPGCGPGSPCAQAAASVWGKVPGVNWPVSHVGLAYFLALLLGWLRSTHGVSHALRWLVRAGALVSLMFVGVIVTEGHYCTYCLIAHGANFAFWGLVEFAAKPAVASLRPAGTVAVTFAIATFVLALAELRTKETVRQEGERQLAESTDAIIRATTQRGNDAQTTPVVAGSGNKQEPAAKRWPGGFTGRHRVGPEKAPIRIVVMSDYQCPDCLRVEQDIAKIMETRNDVSLSFKHFPMCKDCNKHVSMTLHDNACWAARAAEAAGLLYGPEGFWKMHRWLFEKRGRFTTNEELSAGLTRLGFDPSSFIAMLSSPQTLEGIYEDVEDANWLGIHYTPMVFINGVEVRSAALIIGSVPRAVDAVAAAHPPAATHEYDQPPPAAEKLVADWRDQPQRLMPTPIKSWPLGGDDARVKISVWGDFQEPNTAKVDQIIRKFMGQRPECQYTFRHFPVNQECNPNTQVSRHPQACLAHKAAIAAGVIGGADVYWKMHEWLIANQAGLTEDALKQAAQQMGLDVPRFIQVMNAPETAQAIARDAQVGRSLNLTAVPMIFVNGKLVPRWVREGSNVFEQILVEAGRK